MEDKLVALSASRLKVLKDCSWLYWCKYGPWKLPDKTNKGALCGTCCHTIFECLTKERHAKHFSAIVDTHPSTVRNSKSVDRYVRRYVNKHDMEDVDYKLIDSMIVVGLMYDFFCKKGNGARLKAEVEFDITNQKPKFRIKGFIDKMAEYVPKSLLRIVDYKSSKRQFEGEDLETNVQAMIYSIAAKRIYPDLMPIVEFIFLQFPENPVQRLRFSELQLKGFEQYLGEMSKIINNFTLQDAYKNFAADKPMPKGGFSGPLMCGFAKKQGELKKDGTPKWACIYKFPFDYFALCNVEDEVIRTSFKNDLHPKKAKGEYIIKKHYKGCPKWNKTKSRS